MTNTETKSVTPNGEGNKRVGAEAEAAAEEEAEADANSEDLNSGNTGIGSINSKRPKFSNAQTKMKIKR